MALKPSNSSNLQHLALKGYMMLVWTDLNALLVVLWVWAKWGQRSRSWLYQIWSKRWKARVHLILSSFCVIMQVCFLMFMADADEWLCIVLDMAEPAYEYAHPPLYHPTPRKYPHLEPFDRYNFLTYRTAILFICYVRLTVLVFCFLYRYASFFSDIHFVGVAASAGRELLTASPVTCWLWWWWWLWQ